MCHVTRHNHAEAAKMTNNNALLEDMSVDQLWHVCVELRDNYGEPPFIIMKNDAWDRRVQMMHHIRGVLVSRGRERRLEAPLLKYLN